MIRKITLLATFLILIASSDAFSQKFAQSVSIGIEGGVSVSNAHIWPNRPKESFYKVGYIAGLLYDVNYSSKISFRTGVRYLTKGFRGNLPDTLGGFEYETTMYYLEAPLAVKYNLSTGTAKPYLLGGGYFGLNLSANGKFTSGNNTEEKNIDSTISIVDVGLLMGAGVDIRISKKTDLFIQAAYELGLNNIFLNRANDFFNADKYNSIKNYTFLLTGGIKFDL
ncbi:MAG TPA: porin family protein [Ignavibacteria bacterium]|nr:porin family protein [Ignavibacteria bacterium]